MTGRVLLTMAVLAAGTGFAMAQDVSVAQDLPEAPDAVSSTKLKILAKPAAGTMNLMSEAIPTSKGFLAGWNNTKSLDTSVQIRSFSKDGAPLDSLVKLNKTTYLTSGKPKFAPIAGDKFAVVWKQFSNIEGGVFDLTTNKFTALKTSLAVTQGAAHHEIVTLSNGRVALAVMQAVTGFMNNQVRVYTFDSKLKTLSGPVTMNGAGYESTATSADFTIVDAKTGGFAIWRHRPTGDLLMRSFTAAGKAAGGTIKVNTTKLPTGLALDVATFSVSAVKLTNDRILVTWTSLENFGGKSGYDIRARLFSATGTPIGDDFRVNTDRVETQYFPEPVALAGGGFAIGWVSNVFSTLTRTHFIRSYKSNGDALTPARKTHIIPPVPTDSNVDTSLVVLKDGSLVNVFHEGAGQPVVADGISKNILE